MGPVVGLRLSRSGLAIDIIKNNDPLVTRGFKVHQR
jgi:hypothetical protein